VQITRQNCAHANTAEQAQRT